MQYGHRLLIAGVVIVGIILIGVVAVRENTASNRNTPRTSAPAESEDLPQRPVFKLKDLRGVDYDLVQYEGSPVVVHFMSVGCDGRYSEVNDNQLRQLKIICDSFCNQTSLKIFTVLVSTCSSTDLSQLYNMYNLTWILGNDYQDNKFDIVETYSEYEVVDGSIVLLEKDLTFHEAYHEKIKAENLITKIEGLLEAS